MLDRALPAARRAARAPRGCRSRPARSATRPRCARPRCRGRRASDTVAAVRGHGDHEPVRGERDRLLDEALGVELVRELRVGGGEHVRPRALADLRGQLVRAREAEAHVRVVEGRRRSPRTRSSATRPRTPAASGCRRHRRSRRAQRAPGRRARCQRAARLTSARPSPRSPSPSRSPSTPGARPSSSTASRVIAAVTRCGPASISTSAITPSDLDRHDLARRTGCAPTACPRRGGGAGARRAARTSRRGTRRRLRSSRTARSLPARSQRRSVSTLTPISRAASPRVRSVERLRRHLPKHCIGRLSQASLAGGRERASAWSAKRVEPDHQAVAQVGDLAERRAHLEAARLALDDQLARAAGCGSPGSSRNSRFSPRNSSHTSSSSVRSQRS